MFVKSVDVIAMFVRAFITLTYFALFVLYFFCFRSWAGSMKRYGPIFKCGLP